jgi:hypothetical protein
MADFIDIVLVVILVGGFIAVVLAATPRKPHADGEHIPTPIPYELNTTLTGTGGPVINFHQRFIAQNGSGIIDNSHISELGWRKWWLREKEKSSVAPDTNFCGIPTRTFLDKFFI